MNTLRHHQGRPAYGIRNSLSGIACLFLLCLFLLPAGTAEADTDNDMVVHVEKIGDAIVVDVSFSVHASQLESWNVLTDFDHMHEFVSNLQSSRIISRNANRLHVAQTGRAARGVLSFAFDSVREVDLSPHHAIRTRLLSGNMKKLDGLTQLRTESGMTRVDYHGESIPNIWVPPVVGIKFIEHELQEQFREMRAEILKRKAAHA